LAARVGSGGDNQKMESDECRLLTLVCPGGIGKTRLALTAAPADRDLFRNGVRWVPLLSVFLYV
jgi:predicted ATPase